MSMQQVAQSKPSSNGFGRRKVEREMGTRLDNKLQSGKSNFGSYRNAAGALNGGKIGDASPSRDRLIYLTTCLIGHYVEVQVKNGSIFSGIFHATNAEKDFGIILKMARLTKDGAIRGQKSISSTVSNAFSKTLIIPAKELVQVIAKGVSVTGNELANGVQHERRQDIMIDSYISQSHSAEVGRELERWTPDGDDLQCPELENIFDGTWNRNWDQFQINEALFGVKSTFNEELYTTKLERGPQMREREREASRIAREIEGEETRDLHLAEERGLNFHEDFDIDEETRFSSVYRVDDDSGYKENEDMMLDSHNTETFGYSSDVPREKSDDGAQASPSSSLVDEAQFSQLNGGTDPYHSGSSDHARQLDGESRLNENQFREQYGGKNCTKEFTERKTVTEEAQTSKFEDIESPHNTKKASSDKGGLSPSATAYSPSFCASSKGQEHTDSLGESSDGAGSGKACGAIQPIKPCRQPGSSTLSTLECNGAASASSCPGLSSCSYVGSLSSEKSTLNPYAKEFKLNPNAKSFTPSQTPLRPPTPVSDGSYYFPANVPAVPHMHGLPVGLGLGPTATYGGPQSVIYNPQAAPIQSSQAYIHPNGALYGQQMILGHPRPVLYMPNYPPEMPYKGRDF